MSMDTSTKTKILYVEDELALANIVKDTLEGQGYQVKLVSDGAKVISDAKDFEPDLCLLDVMLPNIDGFTLGSTLTSKHPDLPIIFLTAKNQTADVIKGFQSGGNDYMKKPFSMEELFARMNNLLALKGKRQQERQVDYLRIGAYQFYPNKLLLILGESSRKLTHRESEIIHFFAKHINGVVNKKEILLEIWGDDSFYNVRSLDVYINKLRDFFAKDPNISILTLRGVGYRFNV